MNYTAASAAAPDDNVFYDSGRAGRKIAHCSTFRTCGISNATFQNPKRRLDEQIYIFLTFIFLSKTWQRRGGGGDDGEAPVYSNFLLAEEVHL